MEGPPLPSLVKGHKTAGEPFKSCNAAGCYSVASSRPPNGLPAAHGPATTPRVDHIGGLVLSQLVQFALIRCHMPEHGLICLGLPLTRVAFANSR